MNLYEEALARFQESYQRAQRAGLREPTAATLATADAAGRPAARTVLLKGCDANGFVFYTNTMSRKGLHIAENPRVALLFYWDPLWEQAHVEGTAGRVSDGEADAYWAGRPRESQLGAWASLQSQTLESRDVLKQRFAEFEAKFAGHSVPRPPHWSGYRVVPNRLEFWVGKPQRLHERTVYELSDGQWTKRLVYP